ncbi:MAG: zinc-binding dehydrogenase [Anaerolineae bacterium]
MKALQIEASVPRYLISKALGAIYKPVHWSPLSLIRIRDVPEPAPPGPDWAKVRTKYGGICGSDMSAVLSRFNPSLSVFASSQFTLGHENVATLVEVGSGVAGFAPGDRVVADPPLPCETRGIAEPCEFCRRGQYSVCQNFAEGDLSPGVAFGWCAETGGSWSPYFLTHRSQLFQVPEGVSDENALMAEPLGVALHAVLPHFPQDDHIVLVMGAGSFGLCIVAALRALGSRARILVVAKYPFQGEMARSLGANEIIRPGENLIDELAEATGARLYTPILGKRVMLGGVDLVFECVGSNQSIDDSLRVTRTGGAVVQLSFAHIPKGVDWTPIWYNQVRVTGSNTTGWDTWGGRRVRSIELALELMAEGKVDLTPLVTHRFALEDYKKALALTAAKGKHHLIKSVFAFE